MRALSENANNDLFLGPDNKLSVSEGLLALVQTTKSAVEVQKGELIFSKEKGIPTDQALWSGTPDLQQFEFYVRKTILAISGVIEILTFEAEIIDDHVDYTAQIKTIYGEGEVSGII